MERLAAARPLTAALPAAAVPRGGGWLTFATATAADDAGIRRMLRETAFPGRVRLSFEREPDSLAVQIEGDVHDVIVARERTGDQVVAAATRSSRDRFVNGRPARVGYLGQLRIAPGRRAWRELLGGGFRFCRALHDRDTAAFYLASIVAGNVGARRLLERGLPGWPSFRPVDDLIALAIPARGGLRHRSPAVQIVGGESIGRHELASLLARNNSRYQFAPCWTADDLSSQPGLVPADFLVAVRSGRIAGCAALWDQRAFKQVVVRGYSKVLERLRPLINSLGPFAGISSLPSVGAPLAFAYLSHVAVDDDDPDVMIALVAAARRAALARRLDYITVGSSCRSPLNAPVRQAFPHRSYASILYVAAWPDGEPMAAGLDGRPSHPEMALL